MKSTSVALEIFVVDCSQVCLVDPCREQRWRFDSLKHKQRTVCVVTLIVTCGTMRTLNSLEG